MFFRGGPITNSTVQRNPTECPLCQENSVVSVAYDQHYRPVSAWVEAMHHLHMLDMGAMRESTLHHWGHVVEHLEPFDHFSAHICLYCPVRNQNVEITISYDSFSCARKSSKAIQEFLACYRFQKRSAGNAHRKDIYANLALDVMPLPHPNMLWYSDLRSDPNMKTASFQSVSKKWQSTFTQKFPTKSKAANILKIIVKVHGSLATMAQAQEMNPEILSHFGSVAPEVIFDNLSNYIPEYYESILFSFWEVPEQKRSRG